MTRGGPWSRASIYGLLLAAAVDFASPAAAAAGAAVTEVPVRTGVHDGYSRLVFDWDAPVAYRLEQAPGRAVLYFSRPARLDLSRFRADPGRLIPALTMKPVAEGSAVELSLPPGVSLRHFMSDSKVVVDVLAPRRVASRDLDAIAADAVLAATVARQVPETARAARRLPTRLDPEPGAPEPRSAQARRPKTRSKARAASGSKIAIAFERPSLPPWSPAPGASAPRTRPLTLRVTGAPDAAAAAFRRGRSLWLVFDRPARADIAKRLAKFAPELMPVEQRALEGATLLRLTAPADLAPALRREEGGWIVELRPQLARPEVSVEPEVRAGGPQPGVRFPVAGAGRVVSLDDPDLGGRIHVLPVVAPGLGLLAAREFPQFRALATYQGLAVAPRSDRIRVARDETGFEVTSSGDLLVTPRTAARQDPTAAALTEHGRRLFELPAWRLGDDVLFERNRRVLQRRLVTPGPGQRPEVARLDLGRFYFAHGLASEALSELNLMARDNPELARDPQVILLRAASLFLVQDYRAVADGLAEPALAGEPEALVWRAAQAAAAQDWAYAAEVFDQTGPLLADYIHPVRTRLWLLAAESHLAVGDTGGASLYLEQVREDAPAAFEQAQLDFLEGRRLLLDGETETAEALWRRVAGATHAPSRARARLALVDLGLETGGLDTAAAIEELERLRFLWRADDFELALLERLGGLYAAARDYRQALHSLRQAASHFPGSPRAKAVARKMREIFAGLYLEGGDRTLPPVRALALYEEFKELTPVGPAGDRMIANLVEQLVEIDLLGRAATLLEDQIAQRLKGADRARGGARLALVRLLDRQPEQALDALAGTAWKQLPEDLRRRRRLLEARALGDLGRGREALGLLAGDESEEGLRLRAGILWELRDWPAAAVALSRLVPKKPPAGGAQGEAEDQTVLDLAVAYSLAGDRKALSDLKQRYGPAMAAGSRAESFALLTSDFRKAEITKVAQELAGVERIQAFMAGYRALSRGTP
ncbi:MAG: hypothetical protein OEU09_11395 [Rhodospirillales bacterium]|nr:hypothetical protein [Rhodospirillales bacterium]MDH3911892.1 hypothetical protein [Rhodospirillales bacterium]MDH3965577.1 hypothetical protein [Rhodospirillales bacterium]